MARDFPTARVSLWVPPAPAGTDGCWSHLVLRLVQATMTQTPCEAWRLVPCRVRPGTGARSSGAQAWHAPSQHAPLLGLCGASPWTPTSPQLESAACPLTRPTGNPGCPGKPRGRPEGHTSGQQTQTHVHSADAGTLTRGREQPRAQPVGHALPPGLQAPHAGQT